MVCPICNSYDEFYKMFECESFDDSYLYKDVYVYKCKRCGHLYNELTTIEMKNLNRYYTDEYAPSNLSSEDKNGDKPGTNNYSNIRRYGKLYYFIKDYLKKDTRILDVGCAMGSFLNFLRDKGCKNLYGIDPIEEYVNKTKDKNIKVGNIYSIPFGDNSFDIIILDQVLEHLSNLKLTMKEIKRVLTKGGICYIGVPDQEKYNDEVYWYIMREHIQHFKLINLKLLAQLNGFELIKSSNTENDMIGTLSLPNLSILLKPSGKVYCFGIGREFMYLYQNTRLKDLDIILVDDTPYKQKQTFKGKKIHGSEILKEASKDSFVIITAMVHKDTLETKLFELGYKGEIINV